MTDPLLLRPEAASFLVMTLSHNKYSISTKHNVLEPTFSEGLSSTITSTEEQSSRRREQTKPSRESATRIASGSEKTLTMSDPGRVKRNAGLARGSGTISESLCCDLEAEPELQKIGQGGRFLAREIALSLLYGI